MIGQRLILDAMLMCWYTTCGRDLIASADTILNMARTCEAVLGNVKSVQVRWCV